MVQPGGARQDRQMRMPETFSGAHQAAVRAIVEPAGPLARDVRGAKREQRTTDVVAGDR